MVLIAAKGRFAIKKTILTANDNINAPTLRHIKAPEAVKRYKNIDFNQYQDFYKDPFVKAKGIISKI